MNELNESQLLLLNNLIYLQGVADSNKKTVKEIVDSLIKGGRLEESINQEAEDAERKYPFDMTRGEWENLLEKIYNDEQLSSLTLTHGITGEMPDKNGQPIMKNGKILEAGMRAATFVDPDGHATVVFRGTGGDFEWFDNGQGGYLADTPQQIAALEYIESLEYDNIIAASRATV